ncbi:hypothetical protein DFH29DRAFT_878237 [Suillus ampliporus]|nr:hypothetical protein DFH29DRAFT_878237 [Suillus ampliporus]
MVLLLLGKWEHQEKPHYTIERSREETAQKGRRAESRRAGERGAGEREEQEQEQHLSVRRRKKRKKNRLTEWQKTRKLQREKNITNINIDTTTPPTTNTQDLAGERRRKR